MARILIADIDNDTVQTLVAELEGDGHEVAEVDSGLDAYQSVLASPPDIVFLGPNIPVHDGYETCSLLRADPDVPDHLPIVILGSQDLDTRRLERAGVTTSLSRTHGASDLREMVSQLLARK